VRRLEIGGRTVEVPVRVSRRARKLSIHVDVLRNVEIVVPRRTTQDEIDALLFEHRAWLERQLAKPPKPFHLGLQRDDVVWIGGLALSVPSLSALDAWYREQARAELSRVAAHEARQLGVAYKRITIRDQLTRWGSCSRAGALSFNWRLVIAPPAILTYVVVHELCHRIHHDHSTEFLGAVAAARPTYEEERAWLSEHGAELLAYRVPQRRAA